MLFRLFHSSFIYVQYSGSDPGFQVRGGGGGALKFVFGVFRVKNHDFTQKILFFPILGGGGGRASCAPALDPPLVLISDIVDLVFVLDMDEIFGARLKAPNRITINHLFHR